MTRNGEQLSGPRLGTRKARVLVAVLASARGATVPVERLAEAVWATDQPRDPQANLATLASRLRKTLGEGFVVQTGTGYAVGRDAVLDLDLVADLHSTGSARLTRGEPTLAVAAATRALVTLGGDAGLAPECDGSWSDPLRGEADELCRQARHLLALAATATGDAEVARSAALAATQADPYDEQAHRDLMTALVGNGRPTAALEVYAALAGRLAEELGTDPDAESQALQLVVLRGDAAAAATPPPPPRALQPWSGRCRLRRSTPSPPRPGSAAGPTRWVPTATRTR